MHIWTVHNCCNFITTLIGWQMSLLHERTTYMVQVIYPWWHRVLHFMLQIKVGLFCVINDWKAITNEQNLKNKYQMAISKFTDHSRINIDLLLKQKLIYFNNNMEIVQIFRHDCPQRYLWGMWSTMKHGCGNNYYIWLYLVTLEQLLSSFSRSLASVFFFLLFRVFV